MRAAFLAGLLAAPCCAQPVSQAPWMTGERLLALVAFPAAPGRSELDAHADEQRAKLYIHGVHDATEGKSWCYGVARRPKPDLLEAEAVDGIKGMNPDQLKRNAADLLVEVWRVRNPCKKDRP